MGPQAPRKEGGSPTHPEPSSGSRAGPCGCCDCSSIYRCAGGCMLLAPRPEISSLLQSRCGAGCLQLVLIRPLSGSSPHRASSLCSAAGGRGSCSRLVKGTWQRGRAHVSGRKLLPCCPHRGRGQRGFLPDSLLSKEVWVFRICLCHSIREHSPGTCYVFRTARPFVCLITHPSFSRVQSPGRRGILWMSGNKLGGVTDFL